MKPPGCLVLFLLIFFGHGADAQPNHKPRIVGQQPLAMQEDQSLTIQMTYLAVDDRDDWFYPWGFTMTLFPGDNYTLSGNVVTPAPNFNGKLHVQVSVHDGESESNRFNLEITVNPVNDAPVITGHAAVSTDEGQPVAIQLSHVQVSDPDNPYPNDFSLTVYGGTNYSTQGTTVVPQPGFVGTLSVSIVVNDGQLNSAVYALPVIVRPVNRVPEITGQAVLELSEDASITIDFPHLTVKDDDSNYPQGFTLSVAPGEHYAVTNRTVTPTRDFFGKLSVPVSVSDGLNMSKPYTLSIQVLPINDAPQVTDIETTPLHYTPRNVSVAITGGIHVRDVDGDSIMFAVVSIDRDTYRVTADRLIYDPRSPIPGIHGVFDATAGTLTLTGRASPARYASALRSVRYQSIAPVGDMKKTFYFWVNDGQSDSDTVARELVYGSAAVALDIPTAFTPNGDQANDTWKIIPLQHEEAYSGARIRVYNKAGILVYESTGLEHEWDGRLNGELLPADTYFYTIDLNINAPEGYVKGLVTILR